MGALGSVNNQVFQPSSSLKDNNVNLEIQGHLENIENLLNGFRYEYENKSRVILSEETVKAFVNNITNWTMENSQPKKLSKLNKLLENLYNGIKKASSDLDNMGGLSKMKLAVLKKTHKTSDPIKGQIFNSILTFTEQLKDISSNDSNIQSLVKILDSILRNYTENDELVRKYAGLAVSTGAPISSMPQGLGSDSVNDPVPEEESESVLDKIKTELDIFERRINFLKRLENLKNLLRKNKSKVIPDEDSVTKFINNIISNVQELSINKDSDKTKLVRLSEMLRNLTETISCDHTKDVKKGICPSKYGVVSGLCSFIQECKEEEFNENLEDYFFRYLIVGIPPRFNFSPEQKQKYLSCQIIPDEDNDGELIIKDPEKKLLDQFPDLGKKAQEIEEGSESSRSESDSESSVNSNSSSIDGDNNPEFEVFLKEEDGKKRKGSNSSSLLSMLRKAEAVSPTPKDPIAEAVKSKSIFSRITKANVAKTVLSVTITGVAITALVCLWPLILAGSALACIGGAVILLGSAAGLVSVINNVAKKKITQPEKTLEESFYNAVYDLLFEPSKVAIPTRKVKYEEQLGEFLNHIYNNNSEEEKNEKIAIFKNNLRELNLKDFEDIRIDLSKTNDLRRFNSQQHGLQLYRRNGFKQAKNVTIEQFIDRIDEVKTATLRNEFVTKVLNSSVDKLEGKSYLEASHNLIYLNLNEINVDNLLKFLQDNSITKLEALIQDINPNIPKKYNCLFSEKNKKETIKQFLYEKLFESNTLNKIIPNYFDMLEGSNEIFSEMIQKELKAIQQEKNSLISRIGDDYNQIKIKIKEEIKKINSQIQEKKEQIKFTESNVEQLLKNTQSFTGQEMLEPNVVTEKQEEIQKTKQDLDNKIINLQEEINSLIGKPDTLKQDLTQLEQKYNKGIEKTLNEYSKKVVLFDKKMQAEIENRLQICREIQKVGNNSVLKRKRSFPKPRRISSSKSLVNSNNDSSDSNSGAFSTKSSSTNTSLSHNKYRSFRNRRPSSLRRATKHSLNGNNSVFSEEEVFHTPRTFDSSSENFQDIQIVPPSKIILKKRQLWVF